MHGYSLSLAFLQNLAGFEMSANYLLTHEIELHEQSPEFLARFELRRYETRKAVLFPYWVRKDELYEQESEVGMNFIPGSFFIHCRIG